MTKQDLQAELKAKIKEGIKPSQLKRSTSTPVKSIAQSLPKPNEQAETISKLEQQKADLLKLNQEAVQQNEQLTKLIEQLKAEKNQLEQAKSEWEEKYLEKRLALLKTPLNSAWPKPPHRRTELIKTSLIILLLILLILK